MHLWRKFGALSGEERRLVFEASVVGVALRAILGVARFGWLLRRVEAASPRPVSHGVRPAAERIAWAMDAAGRRLLGPDTCLLRALGGRLLLARYGYSAVIRIGIVRTPSGGLAAHAWVECGGRIVVGGNPTRAFTLLEPGWAAAR